MKLPFQLRWHQILISFLIGTFAGVVLDQHCPHRHFKHWKPGEMQNRMVEKLTKELRLNETQKTQVKTIFEQKHPQMVALHNEMRPKFEAIKNETRTEIRKILTPEQAQKFEEMNAKWEEQHKNGPFGPGN